MPLHGEIVPRAEARPEQFKALGAALRRWFGAYVDELKAGGPDVKGWIDESALRDLEAGDLPQPTLLRFLGGQPGLKAAELRDALERARAAFPLVGRAVPRPESRSVAFGVSTSDSAEARGVLFGSLRRHLPAESIASIADVIIDGNSVGPP